MALLLDREDTERWNLTLSVAILKTTTLRVRFHLSVSSLSNNNAIND